MDLCRDQAGGTVTDTDPSNYNGVTEGLPVTGIDTDVLALIALLLLAVGAVLIGYTRFTGKGQNAAQ